MIQKETLVLNWGLEDGLEVGMELAGWSTGMEDAAGIGCSERDL